MSVARIHNVGTSCLLEFDFESNSPIVNTLPFKDTAVFNLGTSFASSLFEIIKLVPLVAPVAIVAAAVGVVAVVVVVVVVVVVGGAGSVRWCVNSSNTLMVTPVRNR